MSGELFSIPTRTITGPTVHSRTIPVPIQPTNDLGIAGFVYGVVGIALFNVNLCALILGPLAVIFGGLGWSRANEGARHKGLAVLGVVLGVISLVVFGAMLVWSAKHGGRLDLPVGR